MEGADEVDVVDAIHRKSGDVEVDKRGRQEAARVRDEHVRREDHARERGVVCERRGVNEGGKCVEEKCNALGATAATDVPVLRNGGTNAWTPRAQMCAFVPAWHIFKRVRAVVRVDLFLDAVRVLAKQLAARRAVEELGETAVAAASALVPGRSHGAV